MDDKTAKYGLDWVFVKKFIQISKYLFPKCLSVPVFLFILLLLFSLLEQFIIYEVGMLPGGYIKVLGSLDIAGFWNQTIVAVLWISANVIIKSVNKYTAQVLYIKWRQLLSHAIHRVYLVGIRYYQLTVIDDKIDNPDQRITQDVDKLCQSFSKVLLGVIVVPFTIVYYCYQSAERSGYIGPVGVFFFFLVSTMINKVIMSPVVNLVVQQEKREGYFRFMHMQVRVNSESIAMLGSDKVESQKVNSKLDSLIGTQMRLNNWQFILSLSVNFFDYMGTILSYLILAIPIFNGKYDQLTPAELAEVISKNSFVCMYLIHSFSLLVDQLQQVTDIAGTAHRVGELLETLSELSSQEIPPDDDHSCSGGEEQHSYQTVSSQTAIFVDSPNGMTKSGHRNVAGPVEVVNLPLHKESGLIYSLDEVGLGAPRSDKLLIRGLTFDFTFGTNVLITGNSSSGKSSLLRFLRGLWTHQEGTIKRFVGPGPTVVLFLPQKPFCTEGSLRQQIIYPLHEDPNASREMVSYQDKMMIDYINLSGLHTIFDRCGSLDAPVDWNWHDVLSPGEMQRLAFIRLLYHKPKVAVLDEATSAVSINMESILYKECHRLGICLISVGHRDSLRQFHDVELRFDGYGGWTVVDL